MLQQLQPAIFCRSVRVGDHQKVRAQRDNRLHVSEPGGGASGCVAEARDSEKLRQKATVVDVAPAVDDQKRAGRIVGRRQVTQPLQRPIYFGNERPARVCLANCGGDFVDPPDHVGDSRPTG